MRSDPFLKMIALIFLSGCVNFSPAQPVVEFKSSDTAVQEAFSWAKTTAWHYKGNSTDPVGPWYEAALPLRNAFCMRDVSHQIVGAEIMGLSKENKNMLTLFAGHISESKDWCSFWEINKYNKPAPEDYRNDKEFWYNLNANFDIMSACWRIYLWTGDKSYITGPVFTNFFENSATRYIGRWVLQADSLLTRPLYPNAPAPFNNRDSFHRCRGIPSYSEDIPDLKMGVDLIASLYRGLLSYSSMLRFQNNNERAESFEKKAELYRQKIETDWWDNKDSLYFTYCSVKGNFGKGGGESFLLWFDALKDPVRIRKTVEKLASSKTNIEVESYLPLLFYKFGYWDKAHDCVLHLANPATPRREYPEVSFAVMEAVVNGLMGIEPDAVTQKVTTLYRDKNAGEAEIKNLSILNSVIDVKHKAKETTFFNRGKTVLHWRAAFAGKHNFIRIKNVKKKAKYGSDKNGTIFSYTDSTINGGEKITATRED